MISKCRCETSRVLQTTNAANAPAFAMAMQFCTHFFCQNDMEGAGAAIVGDGDGGVGGTGLAAGLATRTDARFLRVMRY